MVQGKELMGIAVDRDSHPEVRSKSREVAGLSLVETSYPPGLKMLPHRHPLAAFGIVLRGGYTESFGKHARTCRPGTVVFHPAGEEHAVEFHEQPVRILRVNLPDSWLRRECEHGA